MLKTMVFIDGAWFGLALKSSSRKRGKLRLHPNEFSFAPLWQAICGHIRSHLGFEVDLVRAYCVVGYADPATVATGSQDAAKKIVGFLEQLRRVDGMPLELYPYSYHGGEFYQEATDEQAKAGEKCVDVALATKMLYFAAVPGAYDVAVLLGGDLDYMPVVRAVRSLGKRTMLAFLEPEPCAAQLRADSARGDLWDIEALALDELVTAQLAGRPSA